MFSMCSRSTIPSNNSSCSKDPFKARLPWFIVNVTVWCLRLYSSNIILFMTVSILSILLYVLQCFFMFVIVLHLFEILYDILLHFLTKCDCPITWLWCLITVSHCYLYHFSPEWSNECLRTSMHGIFCRCLNVSLYFQVIIIFFEYHL